MNLACTTLFENFGLKYRLDIKEALMNHERFNYKTSIWFTSYITLRLRNKNKNRLQFVCVEKEITNQNNNTKKLEYISVG